jgi:hypothetical protein
VPPAIPITDNASCQDLFIFGNSCQWNCCCSDKARCRFALFIESVEYLAVCDAIDVALAIGLLRENKAQPFCTTFLNLHPQTVTVTKVSTVTSYETTTKATTAVQESDPFMLLLTRSVTTVDLMFPS